MGKDKENVKLNSLMFLALDHGVDSVRAGGHLIPFVMTESKGKRSLNRFASERLEVGQEEARKFVSKSGDKTEMYALAYDGFVTIEGKKYDAIIVEAGQRGNKEATLIAQRYKPKKLLQKFEVIGNPALIGSNKNLLK